jgi:hypothetical protein
MLGRQAALGGFIAARTLCDAVCALEARDPALDANGLVAYLLVLRDIIEGMLDVFAKGMGVH